MGVRGRTYRYCRCGSRSTTVTTGSRSRLFKPATAVRVRFGTNDPTPWRPELPAGKNPLPGGIIDYNLAKDASAPVTLDIIDAAGKVVRHYSTDDRVRDPNPALAPVAYDKACEQKPAAPDCALPLYRPAQPNGQDVNPAHTQEQSWRSSSAYTASRNS